MVNATQFRSWSTTLLLAAAVLTAAAWLRSAEYDEQYTLFLTAGTSRPIWPQTAFPASTIAAVQSGHASLAGIVRDLRATDVHPPLYFWAVSLWRDILGPTLFAARMLSVLCGVASLTLVGIIAQRCAIPPLATMLLTLGCYGFVYTSAIARGFASAQMLTLAGVALLLARRPLLAGISLGAACCCNYLAVFVAAAAITTTGAWVAIVPAIPFLALDTWFFAAQHAARTGQFPPFELWPSLLRLAEYQTAAVFGGLPLYADGIGRAVLRAFIGLSAAGLVLGIARARPFSSGPAIRLVLAAAVAPLIGLLLLGAVFNNTPIELRYLSFGLPFIALLTARAFLPRCGQFPLPFPRHDPLPHHGYAIEHAIEGQTSHPRLCYLRDRKARPTKLIALGQVTLILILTIQSASIIGLLLSPRTMQPARASATEAAQLAATDVVLLPAGNDGVGIVGAFGLEAFQSLPILLIHPTDSIADRLAPYHRVTVAPLAQDRDSVAAIALLHTALTAPNWRRIPIGSNLEVYERTDSGE